jgi:hypothetical protein
MNRVISFLCLAGLITFGLAAEVLATASTHIWAPSTDIQPFGKWHITADMYLPVKKDSFGVRWPTVTNLGLTVGVLPFKNLNLELGLDHKSGTGPADDYPLYGNAKLGVPEGALGKWSPALAAGIYDVGTKKDLTNNDVFYGKVAKSFTAGKVSLGRFSAGYFQGNDKLLLNKRREKDNQGVMLAWERTLSELTDKLWVCGEYQGTESAYGTLNFGFSWKFAPNVSMIYGYDGFNNRNLPPTATLQVDIDI